MLEHEQFVTSISANQRPFQQSSPSDNNSASTATPPHQVSRASPASTLLVMSTNNIAGLNGQASSRQLTPSNGSSNGNGTGSSLGQQSSVGGGNAPNPMARQFTCHTKSMSAGIVVPVPGISNNLAMASGVQQNNMINNAMAENYHNQQISHHHHQQQQMQQQHQHQQLQMQHQHNTLHQVESMADQMISAGNRHQQVAHERRTHHHRSISSQHPHPSISQQQAHQMNQMNPATSYQHQHVGSGHNFVDAGVGGSSSIILNNSNSNNNNSNNVHNRSASVQLSSLIQGSNHHHHHSQQMSNNTNNINLRTIHRTQISGDQLGSHNYPMKNSIWSIDENLSKSQRKLTASGYLHPPSYMLNPSITDISCDNLSNASRLLGSHHLNGDQGPAPVYYSQHHIRANTMTGHGKHHHSSQAHSLAASNLLTNQAKFLPMGDIIFNLISMIIYFCENVFGIIALIALYYHASSKYWALVGAAIVFGSNCICQYLSLRWLYKMKLDDCRRKREAQEELENEEECERRHYKRMSAQMRNYQCGTCGWLPDGATEVQFKFLISIVIDTVLHILCLGFLVRYVKLVIPVNDSTRVRREARDLSMLRMIHGFIQSIPLLLLQSYMICSQNSITTVANLCMISVIISLVNVCWALASFTKYARKKYLHKFVLSWLSILSQLLWRLGTISSRVAALTIYANYYNYWMLVVLALHWFTMFLWLVKPGNLLRDEHNPPKSKKLFMAMGASWIHCFDYMNFEERNSRTKMGIFYLIMFVENNLLFTVCQTFSAQVTWFKSLVILIVYLGFVFGILFMLLYYKYFHTRVLSNGLSCSQDSIDSSLADQLSPAGKKIAGFKPGTLRFKSESSLTSGRGKYNGNNLNSATMKNDAQSEITRGSQLPYMNSNHQVHQSHSRVFECNFNNGIKKQKAPSTNVRRSKN